MIYCNTDIHAAFRQYEFAGDDSMFHERRTFSDTKTNFDINTRVKDSILIFTSTKIYEN